MEQYQMFIGGRWVDAANDARFETADPYSGASWATIPRASATDAALAVEAADAAFQSGSWCDLTATERGAALRRLGDILTREADHLAGIEVKDNGKLLVEMRAQTRYLPQWFYYFAGLADKLDGKVVPIDRKGAFAYTRYEPLGVVAAITPWNSPLLLAAFKIAPALAAGNTLVWKPSEYTSASALEFCRLLEEAAIPPGVVNVVTGYGHEIGGALVEHPRVAKVAFTGGTETGRSVYGAAAKDVKRVSLELGGKSANIVFADADLDSALNGAIAGIFAASGQTCIAGSRLLLEDEIHDEFVERLVHKAAQAKIGDPMVASTQVGPVTTRAQFDKILDYIAIAQAEGARCVLGGGAQQAPDGAAGLFVKPTIFVDVENGMRIAQEEVFGPVLSVLRFTGEDEAVRIANDSAFGLAAGVWTSDLAKALRLEKRLRVGTVWINTYRAVSVHLPFGGTKHSGIGRENGSDALMSYVEPKSVLINLSGRMDDPFTIQ